MFAFSSSTMPEKVSDLLLGLHIAKDGFSSSYLLFADDQRMTGSGLVSFLHLAFEAAPV